MNLLLFAVSVKATPVVCEPYAFLYIPVECQRSIEQYNKGRKESEKEDCWAHSDEMRKPLYSVLLLGTGQIRVMGVTQDTLPYRFRVR